MIESRLDLVMAFLTEDLGLSCAEWRALRGAIDARLRDVAGVAGLRRRTLILPSEPLGELREPGDEDVVAP